MDSKRIATGVRLSAATAVEKEIIMMRASFEYCFFVGACCVSRIRQIESPLRSKNSSVTFTD